MRAASVTAWTSPHSLPAGGVSWLPPQYAAEEREKGLHGIVNPFFTPPVIQVRTDTWRTAVVFHLEVKMLLPTLLLSGLPAGPAAVLDLTADFAPLLVGLWVMLGLSLLGLGVAIAAHDPREESRQDLQTPARPAPVPDLPYAA